MDAHKQNTLNLSLWIRMELMSIVKIKNIVTITNSLIPASQKCIHEFPREVTGVFWGGFGSRHNYNK